MTNQRNIKILLFSAGIISLFFFVLSRLNEYPEIFENVQLLQEEESGVYGDMYYQSMVDDFKTILPDYYPTFVKSGKIVSADSADILVFGDSFMRMTRVEKNFIQKLNDSLKLKVFFTQEPFVLNYFGNIKFKPGKHRIVLYELIERNISDFFSKPQLLKTSQKKLYLDLFSIFVPENRELKYHFILQKSIFTSNIYQAIINFRFDFFNVISDMTPVYKINPPWLFLYKDIHPKYASFYRKFSNKEIELIASNIADLSEKMNKMYNLDFVFFPVPNKYSIYNKVLNNDTYNNFIPLLIEELVRRNVKVINIYDTFKNHKDLLYYPTDSHWNPEGNRIAFSLFMEQMKKYGYNF
jgi:hypothetical protein